MSFIELHIIQTLPPSNPNRGQDGAPKSVMYGGTLRSRLSSQSQKRAARMWYRQYSDIDRAQLAERSRRWDTRLAELLTIGEPEDRLMIARSILGLFNTKAEKLLDVMVAGSQSNLLFLAAHEVEKLAALAVKNEATLLDLVERAKEYQGYLERDDVKKKKTYDRFPTKAEIRSLNKSIVAAITDTVPGDIAVFGRMMAQLVETSVDGCVQVGEAVSVNEIKRSKTNDGWKAGEIDFFSAVDDIEPIDDADGGAGMIGEITFTSPVFYRYANICTHELERLTGDKELARSSAAAFIEGFIKSLPDGYSRRFAQGALPEFVLIQVKDGQPYNHVPAFSNAINEPEAGVTSISQQAVNQLITRRQDMHEAYGDDPGYSAVVGLRDHYPSVIPLATAIDEALTHSGGK
jgi:CRISPR system Cascade subunit CasC